ARRPCALHRERRAAEVRDPYAFAVVAPVGAEGALVRRERPDQLDSGRGVCPALDAAAIERLACRDAFQCGLRFLHVLRAEDEFRAAAVIHPDVTLVVAPRYFRIARLRAELARDADAVARVRGTDLAAAVFRLTDDAIGRQRALFAIGDEHRTASAAHPDDAAFFRSPRHTFVAARIAHFVRQPYDPARTDAAFAIASVDRLARNVLRERKGSGEKRNEHESAHPKIIDP